MQYLEVGGVRIHYRTIGQGRPLVLVHGLALGDISTWYFIAQRYFRQDYKVILYDMRSHGFSDWMDSGFDLASLSTELGCVIDELAGSDQVYLGGFSYGGLVALEYALHHQDRVGKLALIETPLPPGRVREMYDTFHDQNIPQMIEGMPPNMKKSLLSGGGKVMKTLMRLRKLMEETAMLDEVSGEAPLDANRLRCFGIPVACIYGQDSPVFEDGSKLNRLIPDVAWNVLEANHFGVMEQFGDEVGATLKQFFDG